jgi:hypothetical protein
MIRSWINEVNTTNFRILTSVGIAALAIVFIMIGILWRNWMPTTGQVEVLKGVGIFLAVMMGLDVFQFASKRFSDHEYARAKASGPSPVSVGGPSTVEVNEGADTQIRPTPTPEPSAPQAPPPGSEPETPTSRIIGRSD